MVNTYWKKSHQNNILIILDIHRWVFVYIIKTVILVLQLMHGDAIDIDENAICSKEKKAFVVIVVFVGMYKSMHYLI